MSEVLQEYLVALGWKNDEASQKKIVAALDTMSMKVDSVASAIESLTSRVVGATRRMADSFGELYYASQRTNVSAGYIKAFSYAVSQMGGSADAAAGSIERFSERLRSSPGNGGYWAMLRSMGVTARDTEGALRQLGAAFRRLPYYRAKQYAESLGIDEDTMRAMIRNVDQFTARYAEKMRAVGLDPETAARNAATFRNTWRDTLDTISVVIDKVADELLKAFGGDFKRLNEWLLENADKIAKIIVKVTQAFADLAVQLIDWAAKSKEPTEMLHAIAGRVDSFAKAVHRLVKEIRDLIDMANKLGESTGLTWLLNKLGYYGPETSAPGSGGNEGAGGGGGLWKRFTGAIERGLDHIRPGGARNRSLRDASRRGHGAAPSEQEGSEAPAPTKPGTYRPVYKLGEADLSDAVVNTIAGEASYRKKGAVDAVINNMLNRVGSKGWGPSGNLREVARAPDQYEGYKVAGEKEAAYIRERIRAIASGGVPDNTKGSNSFRASYYTGPWMQKHGRNGVNIGGNVFAFQPGVRNGPYAPYDKPRIDASGAGNPAPWAGGLPSRDVFRRGLTPSGPAMNSWQNSTTINQTNHNTISGVTDPTAAAREVERGLNRTNAGLLRNLEGGAQ